MLKVSIITQLLHEGQFWQESFASAMPEHVELTLQKDFTINKDADLIVMDFSTINSKGIEILTDLNPELCGRHFLIVSDQKDADLAIFAIKFGAIGFLVKPFKRSELIASLERLKLDPVDTSTLHKNARIITITSYKGGTGVSTVVSNLAYVLSHVYQKRTLIIDAAGFSNHISVLLNVIPKCTLADVCRHGEIDEQYLKTTIATKGKNLSVIGGLLKPSDFNDLNLYSVERLMELSMDNYDYVVIDTSSHALDEMTMYFINKATDLLILTTFDLLAIRDNRFYIQTLKDLGIGEHKIKPVVNRQNWYIGSLEPDLIQEQLHHQLFFGLPNDWQTCVEAANYGKSVLELAPTSQLASAYETLGGKFVKEDSKMEAERKSKSADAQKKKGLLSWFS